MGRALPGWGGRDQPQEGQAPSESTDGRPHPRTAARAPGRGPQRRRATQADPDAARRRQVTQQGALVVGSTLRRSVVGSRGDPSKIWVDDPSTGKRRDLVREEDHAFWAWAIVEVLRATGIRVEELLELSHHSLVQYRLPTTGELVPLLQIAPSKTDTERLLVVSPDLADVLASIINRVRDRSGAMPLVAAYDGAEHLWATPAPLLFQRRVGSESRPIARGSVGKLLSTALAHTGLIDPVTGSRCITRRTTFDECSSPTRSSRATAAHRPDHRWTPRHQRHFGYKAIYPEEAIQATAFLSRRRSLRPSEEYRTPTDQEWEEFLGHFERRKVSTGTCARAFGTPCIHEHACIRCPMLWPDPAHAIGWSTSATTCRPASPKLNGKTGSARSKDCKVSLAGAPSKLTDIDRRTDHQP